MGYSERDAVTGTLYNANMMISPEGEALNHRKLKPCLLYTSRCV